MREIKLAVYHESVLRDNKMVDRFWVAPAGLGLTESRTKKIHRSYFKKRRSAELYLGDTQ